MLCKAAISNSLCSRAASEFTIFKVFFAYAIELIELITVIPGISKQMEQCPRMGKIVARWHLAIAITSSRIYRIQSRYNETSRCSETFFLPLGLS